MTSKAGQKALDTINENYDSGWQDQEGIVNDSTEDPGSQATEDLKTLHGLSADDFKDVMDKLDPDVKKDLLKETLSDTSNSLDNLDPKYKDYRDEVKALQNKDNLDEVYKKKKANEVPAAGDKIKDHPLTIPEIDGASPELKAYIRVANSQLNYLAYQLGTDPKGKADLSLLPDDKGASPMNHNLSDKTVKDLKSFQGEKDGKVKDAYDSAATYVEAEADQWQSKDGQYKITEQKLGNLNAHYYDDMWQTVQDLRDDLSKSTTGSSDNKLKKPGIQSVVEEQPLYNKIKEAVDQCRKDVAGYVKDVADLPFDFGGDGKDKDKDKDDKDKDKDKDKDDDKDNGDDDSKYNKLAQEVQQLRQQQQQPQQPQQPPQQPQQPGDNPPKDSGGTGDDAGSGSTSGDQEAPGEHGTGTGTGEGSGSTSGDQGALGEGGTGTGDGSGASSASQANNAGQSGGSDPLGTLASTLGPSLATLAPTLSNSLKGFPGADGQLSDDKEGGEHGREAHAAHPQSRQTMDPQPDAPGQPGQEQPGQDGQPGQPGGPPPTIAPPPGADAPPPGTPAPQQKVPFQVRDGVTQQVSAPVHDALTKQMNGDAPDAEAAYRGTPGDFQGGRGWTPVHDQAQLQTGDVVRWSNHQALIVVEPGAHGADDGNISYADHGALVPLSKDPNQDSPNPAFGHFVEFDHPTGIPVDPKDGGAGNGDGDPPPPDSSNDPMPGRPPISSSQDPGSMGPSRIV